MKNFKVFRITEAEREAGVLCYLRDGVLQVEVFPELIDPKSIDERVTDGENFEPGYYWWSHKSGELPEDPPVGPFETSEEAVRDALGRGEQ